MFILDLIVEVLNQDDDDNGPARKETFFAGARLTDDELQRAAQRNLALGHDLRAGLMDPTPGQLHALKAIICHVLAHHYRDVIAYRAGWTDPERQQPVGEPFHGLRPERQAGSSSPHPKAGYYGTRTRWRRRSSMLDHDRPIDLQLWNTITLEGTLPDQLVRDVIEDPYDVFVSAFRSASASGSAGHRSHLPASLKRPGQALPLSAG